MKTFENYLREQTGLTYYDCYVLNVETEEIRNLFADWIKKENPSMAMISNAIDVMARANINF